MRKYADVKKDLMANLEEYCIKQREGARGMTLDYLEGYHVIDEMNRIFGFDAWSYTTTLVHQETVEGKRGPQWQIIVKVTLHVTIEDRQVTREDVGFGNGDIELAYKEAVTDALKRAARTFGNPLGNALYNKERTNVGPPTLSKKDARDVYKTVEAVFRMAKSKEDLKQCAEDNSEVLKSLPVDWKGMAQQEYKRCMEALEK